MSIMEKMERKVTLTKYVAEAVKLAGEASKDCEKHGWDKGEFMTDFLQAINDLTEKFGVA